MSASTTPQPHFQPSTVTKRPGTATAGAVIAIVMTSLTTLIWAFGLIGIAVSRSDVNDRPGDRTAALVMVLIFIALSALGLAAAILTLRNSNGWRITTVVFGFIVGALSMLGALGLFTATTNVTDYHHQRTGEVVGGSIALAWGALAIASAILLLVNGANRFYASPPPKVAYVPGMQAFTAPAASATTPAGWYPVDGGQLRWWDGNAWTDHFHTEG